MFEYTEFKPRSFIDWMTVIEVGVKAEYLYHTQGTGLVPHDRLIAVWHTKPNLELDIAVVEKVAVSSKYESVTKFKVVYDGEIYTEWKWFDLANLCPNHLRAYPDYRFGKLEVFVNTAAAACLEDLEDSIYDSLEFDEEGELFFVSLLDEEIKYPMSLPPTSTKAADLWRHAVYAYNDQKLV